MTKKKFTLSVLATFVFVVACATAAQAQTQRTFVAGPGIGLDTNNTVGQGYCSFSNPCRNFSVAYGVTNTGGEIIAVSPGVGYGGLTIAKAITVTGLPGQVAFVAVGASSTGFSVAAGVNEQVLIRNITFNGSGTASSNGILHSSGKLTVESCTFTQLALGFSTTAKANVIDSLFLGNTVGLRADGTGTDTQVFPIVWGPVQLRISGGDILNNTTGVVMANPGYRACPSGFTCGCGPGQGPPLNQDNKLNVFFHLTGGSSSEVLTNVAGNGTFFAGQGASCTSGPDCAAATHAICAAAGTYNFGTNPN